MPQRTRVPWPLVAGGVSDDSADPGGMLPSEALQVENGFFETPTILSVRPGSYWSSPLTDENGHLVSSIRMVKPWEEKGLVVVIAHSNLTHKHYLFKINPDGTSPVRYATPAAYDLTDPVDFMDMVEWPGGKLYIWDPGQDNGMLRFDGTTVTMPLFVLAAGTPSPLKPVSMAVHKNQLLLWGYGDEDVTSAPSLERFSAVGDPDSFDGGDFIEIGQTDEPVTVGISADEFAFVAKGTKWYLQSGDGRQSWFVRPIDLVRGATGPRHAVLFEWNGQTAVFFICDDGPAVITASGPSELLVDKVRRSWAGLSQFDVAFITTDPKAQMVLYAVYVQGATGRFPTRFLGIDVRTGHWAPRDYQMSFTDACPVRQIPASTATPPTLLPDTSIDVAGWQANWVNGQTTPGTTTRHETLDVDAGGSYVADGSVVAGVTTLALAGKLPGRHYRERMRHELGGVFGEYSATQDVRTKCSAPVILSVTVVSGTPGSPFGPVLRVHFTTSMSNGNAVTHFDAGAGVLDVPRTDGDDLTVDVPAPASTCVVNLDAYTSLVGGFPDSDHVAAGPFITPDDQGVFPLCP